MTRQQALRKAIKLFGKNATVRDYGPKRTSSHESRAKARQERDALREKCNTPELRKQHRDELDRLTFESIHYRYSVGVIVMGMFNSVKCCGDSWEGAFRAWELNPSATAHEKQELSPA